MYSLLKFYFDDVEDMPFDVVTQLLKAEFGCKINKNDVYLYLLMARHWDSNGDLICND